jgi:hypothetical protein
MLTDSESDVLEGTATYIVNQERKSRRAHAIHQNLLKHQKKSTRCEHEAHSKLKPF